jgi:hypothetical protein
VSEIQKYSPDLSSNELPEKLRIRLILTFRLTSNRFKKQKTKPIAYAGKIGLVINSGIKFA